MRVWTFTDLLFVGTDKNALVHTCPTLSLPLPLKPQFLRSHIVRVGLQAPNLALVFSELFVQGEQISADETWQLITAVSSTDETPLR